MSSAAVVISALRVNTSYSQAPNGALCCPLTALIFIGISENSYLRRAILPWVLIFGMLLLWWAKESGCVVALVF